MVSWQMRALATFMRLTRKRRWESPERVQSMLAEPKKPAGVPKGVGKRHTIIESTAADFPCISVIPTGSSQESPRRAVIYLHGGGYVHPIQSQHWKFIGQLADAGCQVEVPQYGLAPDHTVAEAIPFVTGVYQRLLESFAPEDIAFAGDSAGGGLALATVQSVLGTLPAPGVVGLITPWVDVSMTNPDIADVAARDPWLSPVGLEVFGEAWVGDRDVTDPAASPALGPCEGLPPITAVIATRDVTHPDTLRLRERCEAAGVPFDLEVGEDLIHVYPLTPTPEGQAAAARLVGVLAGTG